MEFKKGHWIGIGIGLVFLIVSIFFRETRFFFFLVGMGVLSAIAPLVIFIIRENKIAAEKEEMFLEFARDLVESVKTGTPISKTIINIRDKPYGALSKHIQKLGNQISLGIPLGIALQVFSKEVKNKTISRSIVLIGQAEKAGGDIGNILEAVASAVSLSDKLKKERKAAIQILVVQGYIIFFVFIIIILLMQFKIVPLVSGIAGVESLSGSGIGIGGGVGIDPEEISNAFLSLLLIQGFFSGLTIGKLGEGSMKSGIKHSFALMLMSFLMATGANIFIG